MEGWDGGTFRTNEGEENVSDNVSRSEPVGAPRELNWKISDPEDPSNKLLTMPMMDETTMPSVGAPPAGTPPPRDWAADAAEEIGDALLSDGPKFGNERFAEIIRAHSPSAPAPAPQADLLEEARIKLGQLCVPDSKKGAYHRVTTKDTSWFVDWESRLQVHAPSAPAGTRETPTISQRLSEGYIAEGGTSDVKVDGRLSSAAGTQEEKS